MFLHDGSATSATLLCDIRDLQNVPAWEAFFQRYDRLLDQWCRAYSLNRSAAEEVRQSVWLEIAERMRTFRYDPAQSFRGWLRRLCRSRAIDFLRSERRETRKRRTFHEDVVARLPEFSVFDPDQDDDPPMEPLRQFVEDTAAVQQSAQKRLKNPRTWAIFWAIGIEGRPIADVAEEFDMSYTATFAAYTRAAQILREEGDRFREELTGAAESQML